MKVCKKCSRNKDYCDYYKHKNCADGYFNICKECKKQDSIVYYKKKKQDPVWLANERKRCRDKNLKNNFWQNYKTKLQNDPILKRKIILAKIKWINRNPIKRKAHLEVWNALRTGKLKKQPCLICGDLKAHAHHHDYNKPLNVVWLCAKHHYEQHRKTA